MTPRKLSRKNADKYLDHINAQAQMIADEERETYLDDMYQEFLDEIMREYYQQQDANLYNDYE